MTDDVHTLIGAYALNALDDLERARVERHLRSCESCARESAELSATAARLADVSVETPPERLRTNVLRAAQVTRQVPPRTRETPVRDAPIVRLWRTRTAAAVAAGIVAFGLAGATYAIQEQRVRDAQAEAEARQGQNDRIAAVLAAPDAIATTGTASDGGELVVVRSDALDAAVVTRVGMPDPGPERVYQLWLDIGGVMFDAGLMPGVTAIVDDIAPATRVALSTEPSGGSPHPTHPVGIVNLG